MKAHLVGGTLRTVMVAEVLRSLKANKGRVDPAALELGITPRTLRLWKHSWPELSTGGMEKLLSIASTGKSKKAPKPKKKNYYKLKMKSERAYPD